MIVSWQRVVIHKDDLGIRVIETPYPSKRLNRSDRGTGRSPRFASASGQLF